LLGGEIEVKIKIKTAVLDANATDDVGTNHLEQKENSQHLLPTTN
jgi:hypothetical protein